MKKLWVLKKSPFLWFNFFSKKFKYLSHVKKKVQFFESCEKGPSIWIEKKEQFFESNWAKEKVQFFESYFQQKKNQSFEWYPRRVLFFNSLSVFSKKKKIQYLKSLSKIEFCGANFENRAQLLESYEKSQFFESCSKRDQIFVSFFQKKVNPLGHIKKGFNSSKHIENFHLLSHIEKVLLKKNVQFFESNWKEGFHSVSRINRKGSILWVIAFQKKV